MNVRKLTSKIYGNLGEFTLVQPNLYQSSSGRVYLLGNGNPGGKGDGTIFLDKARGSALAYEVPRSIILCDDFSGIKPQPLSHPQAPVELSQERTTELVNVIKMLGFKPNIAIRSSAQVEDQLGQTAAGVFNTEFHGKALDNEESIKRFIEKLLSVYNSAYSERAVRFWERLGYFEIPPISVIIQELVGKQWKYAPQYFLPAISGITNTSSRKVVRVATVLGLGLSAVGEKGLGILHKLPIEEDGLRVGSNIGYFKGDLNDSDIWALALENGNAVHIFGESTAQLFPNHYLKDLCWTFPKIQMKVADLGLHFEKMIGHPVDIEWASEDGKQLSLIQIRPITKKAVIAKPVVAPENIILSSEDVFGQIEREYDLVIVLDSSFLTYRQSEEIEFISKKYPNSLFIFSTNLKQVHDKVIVEYILPFADGIIVQDFESDHSLGTTGMQHLALSCSDDRKSIIYTHSYDLEEKIRARSRSIERINYSFTGKTTVYKPHQPIRLAADDEQDFAMLYFVK